MNIDLMSFSAHKFYGPKGVGGLFVRSFSPMIRLSPVGFGGGQERGLRSGTLNVPCIVGMSEALAISVQMQEAEQGRLRRLSSVISTALTAAFPLIRINGHPEKKLAHNLSLTIPGVESKALTHILKSKLSFSSGSACSTTKVKPSHVLCAIGLSDEETFQTIRLGLGRSTNAAKEIADILIEGIGEIS
jgi:cysteine desulfurase